MDLPPAQYLWPVEKPLYRLMKNGLWAVRTTLPRKKMARLCCKIRQRARDVGCGQRSMISP